MPPGMGQKKILVTVDNPVWDMFLNKTCSLKCLFPSFLLSVAMYREPSLHDIGETVPKAGVTPSKSTSASAIMNGGKPPVNKSKTT